MGKKLILATRKSPLALAQAELAAQFLRERLGAECELLKLVTTGDRQAEWSLEEKGGKGLFTRELEAALLRKDADVAIHSAKDLPGGSAEGLSIAGYLPREDPRDMLILRSGVGAPRTLATSSPRRRQQARLMFPGLEFTEIRGNVDTRLKKIADLRVADGTVLAAAGLKRLGIGSWPGVEFHAIGVESMVPAVGQGAIGIQCRSCDEALFAGVFDRPTARGLGLERAIQTALGGGCQTAMGAYATRDTLYFFHERAGLRTMALSDADFDSPDSAAARILGELGLK
ncbi:MAG: hydroxymethylbilane synthase [Opitutaceae bacterium]|jgi:hydroxymethylbilane synthase